MLDGASPTVPNSQAVTADLSDASMDIDMEAEGGKEASNYDDWKPTHREWAIMISLAFISTMVALDATILVTVLPVSFV
jgi:hypothetical protein